MNPNEPETTEKKNTPEEKKKFEYEPLKSEPYVHRD
jgi:hypothetical protein